MEGWGGLYESVFRVKEFGFFFFFKKKKTPKHSKAYVQPSVGILTMAHLLIYSFFPQVRTWNLRTLKFGDDETGMKGGFGSSVLGWNEGCESKGPFLGVKCHECGSQQSPFQCLPGLFPTAEQRRREEAFFLVSRGPWWAPCFPLDSL